MKKARATPNLDSRQTSQNIDFFNTIRTKWTLLVTTGMAAFSIIGDVASARQKSKNMCGQFCWRFLGDCMST